MRTLQSFTFHFFLGVIMSARHNATSPAYLGAWKETPPHMPIFPEASISHNPLVLLREQCQLYYCQCKWHFKEALKQAKHVSANQRCQCLERGSEKLFNPSCVFISLAVLRAHFVTPLCLCHSNSPIKTIYFPEPDSVEFSGCGCKEINSHIESVIMRSLLVFLHDGLFLLR